MTFLHKLAQRLARLWTASVIVFVAMTACKLPSARSTAPPDAVAKLDLSPSSLTLLTDRTADFVVVALTANADTVDVSLRWTTNGGSISPMSDVGGVQYAQYHAPLQAGSYTVVAQTTAGGVTDSAVVSVSAVPVASVSVTPVALSLNVGQTGQLTATPRDASGNPLSGRVITWTSSSAAVATVNSTGLVTAQGAGTATITATSEGQSGTATSTVTQPIVPVASVGVSPTSLNLTVGQTGQLTATPRDASGNPLTGRVVTWTSSNAAIAIVSTTGLVTAQGAGTATITATSEGQSGTAAITGTQPAVPVASVSISPAILNLSVGQTGQLTATPRDASGNPLTGRVVTWTTSSSAVATVNATGLVTARGAGTATITATSEGKSGTATITVTLVPVATVSVTPATLSLTVGQTGQLTATPRDASGNPLSGRVVTWTTNDGAVATVSGSGVVTGQAAGTVTITATSEGQSGTATITVTQPPVPVASVSVTPSSLSLTVGQTGQLTATPRDASGNPLTGRLITWTTNSTAVATVNSTGLVTAQGVGSATITATSEGQSGSAAVTVTTQSLISGLDFPGNVNWPATSPSMLFVWNTTLSGTTPFPAYPATYIWRVYPRRQDGFWTFLFHARYQTTLFNQEFTNEYYGMHPFKDPPNTPNTMWEISSYGGDTYVDPVVFDQWYTQVAVVDESGGVEYHTYYWNWPNTTTDVVTAENPSKPAASNPAIIVGDAPWNAGYEIPNAIIRGFQYYDVKLTVSEIAQEIAAPGSVRRPWYLNLNPTPSDISDKSGNGHHPSWVGPGRPALWTGTSP